LRSEKSPANEQSCNQRQPKGLGGADRNSPRRARPRVPHDPDRVSARRRAKRQAESLHTALNFILDEDTAAVGPDPHALAAGEEDADDNE
jgi:hypothetical protein